MGGGDVILDISDYVEPDTLVQRKRRGKIVKAAEEFKEYLEDSQPLNGIKVEVILDEEPTPVITQDSDTKSNKKEADKSGGAGETGIESERDTEPIMASASISELFPATTLPPTSVENSVVDLNLDDTTTFGEIEEADVLVAKETDLSKDYESNTRLFNALLSLFRRNPSLAGIGSIELQLGQDQVVEPVAVRRLIAQVQNVIDVHETFIPTSTPILDQFFEKNYNCLSTSLFKPLIYDAKTIYSSHVSANTENDHTVRYEQKAEMLNELLENFKHPPLHRGKRSYSTATLYNTVRKAYVRKESNSFDVFEAQTPIYHFTRHPDGSLHPGYTPVFSTEHDAQRCVSSVRPERYLSVASGFTAYRVSENVDIGTLEGTETKFAIEKREVSYPVLQPQYDDDDDSMALRTVVNGERISIIGFVVDQNRILNSETVIHVDDDLKKIQKLIDSKEQFVVLCPNQLANVLKMLAPTCSEVMVREEDQLRRCFNFESTDTVLSKYKLDIYSVDRTTIAEIRSKITKNILDLIDYVATTQSRNAKYPLARSEEKHPKFFSHIPETVTRIFGLTSFGQDDVEFLSKLKTIGGAEQLYCLAIGIQYLDDTRDMTAVKEEMESLINRARVLEEQSESNESSTVNALDFLHNIGKALKRAAGNKHLDAVHRRIHYLQELSRIYDGLVDKGKHQIMSELLGRVAFMDRRRKQKHSCRLQENDPKVIEGFALSLNEESDEVADGLETSNSAKYSSEYSPNVLPTYFLSPELQSKLIADSSVRLQTHFTARPLLLIARQINTMLHPNKLSCRMSLEEMKAMVYDISEMCDENFSSFERRFFVQELVMSNGMERQEAFAEWKKVVGGELDVKTQKRVSVVLARLILQLELQRPVHSFRKIFPIGGQKSIGKDSQSSFESYTSENKVKYIVTVAAQTADLGKEGRLMNDYQASDLKNIYAYTTSYYDKFMGKPNLIAMKAVADKADQIQTILLTEKTKIQIPHGYTLVESEETLKPLLDRLETYNVSLRSLIHRLETHGSDFTELMTVQRALQKKMYFLVVSFLASVQHIIDRTNESEWNNLTSSSYNPEKYGDEKSTACQPGEVCILATFIDVRDIRPQIREDLRESELLLRSLKPRLHFVRFPRRHTTPTYDFDRKVDSVITVDFASKFHRRVRPYPNRLPSQSVDRVTDISVMDNLVDLLATKTAKDEHWRIAFSAKLTDLGKLNRSEWMKARDSDSAGLLEHFYRTLRRYIRLLSSHLYITVNSYEMIKEIENRGENFSSNSTNQPGDTMEIITARGTIHQMKKIAQLESREYVDEKRQEWDVLYYNREDKLLIKYLGISRLLESYVCAEELSSVVTALPEIFAESFESAHEMMVSVLSSELLRLCNHVLRQNPDAIDVANFSIEFLKRCFKQQDDIDTNEDKLQNMQNRSYEKYLKGISEQSKERSDELWTFRKVGINVECMDDVAEEDQSAWVMSTAAIDNLDDGLEVSVDDIDYENSREDFDIVDDENKMNLFNDDE